MRPRPPITTRTYALIPSSALFRSDARVNEWKAAHTDRTGRGADDVAVPPFPTLAAAFVRLLEHGWDADATARPHGHRTTVVLHVEVESKVAALHLGPAPHAAHSLSLCLAANVETRFEPDSPTPRTGHPPTQT